MSEIASQFVPFLVQVLTLVVIALVTAALAAIRRRLGTGAAADAMQLLAATAGALVAAAADEVRAMKDPLKPGTWDAATAARIRARVLGDLRTLGSDAVARLRASGSLSRADVERLLEQLVEAEVERLRRMAPAMREVTLGAALVIPERIGDPEPDTGRHTVILPPPKGAPAGEGPVAL